jgi:hypothetical protein
MSRSTLEQVLELLINEEREAAEELLHDFIVENARQIHEELLSESDEVVEENLEDLDESEEDITDDLEGDSDEIDTEEFYDEDEMGDDEAEDSLEMGDEYGDEDGGDVESRVDDLESALAQLEAEFEKIMAGEEGEEHEEEDEEGEYGFDHDEEDEDYEHDEEDEDDEKSFDMDLDSEDDLVEYTIPQTAKTGDNGVQTKSTVNANPKRPGDDSNAAPVRIKDGNTSGGKGATPSTISTKNVNVSGNSKAPSYSNQSAKPGDDGVNKKSLM